MLLLLVSIRTFSKAKIGLPDLVQAQDSGKTKYSLQKKANPIKQKYVTRKCCSEF